jgi:tripartite-type tricarboxylate transporter receptor subunit TctC
MRLLLLGLCICAVQAHAFPISGKPVRIVVPFPPGGQTDIQARAIAQRMVEASSLAVIVELYTIATHVQIPHLYREPPWDPFRDFTPITAGARSATVLTAHISAPFDTVQELVAYARANPGKLNYASFGSGSTSHLNGELLKRLAGIDIVHVPYKGSGDATKDHITGTVQLFFDGPTTAIANARSGKVKLIATAAETRKAALPDLPTLREGGYDVGMWGYLWFWGPAGMTPATVDEVHRTLARAIQHPEVRGLFASGGAEASGMPPSEMAQAARSLHERWGAVIRDTGVKLD